MKGEKALKTAHTFNEKMKEITKFVGPLGNGISTDLLDFENINKIPPECK